jgi:hypothetical protein
MAYPRNPARLAAAALLCVPLLGCTSQRAPTTDEREKTQRMAADSLFDQLITESPQFNDAQRFPTLPEGSDRMVPGPNARVWARTFVPADTFAAAAVVHIDTGTAYPAAWGLPSGWSCVKIRRTAAGFEAHHSAPFTAVSSPATAAAACRGWSPSGATTTRTVVPLTLGPGPTHTAPVVRWHWDFGLDRPYLGVACGPDVWCQVATYTPTYTPPPTTPAGVKSNSPGWYDEQLLFVAVGGARYAAVRALIFPALDLDFQPVCGSSPVSDRHVATIVYDTVALPSVDKGDPATTMTQLARSVWRFPTAVSSLPLRTELRLYANCVDGALKTYMRIGDYRSGDHATDPHDHRTELSAIQALIGTGPGAERYDVPGTARWQDKGVEMASWYGCDGQCCAVQML